MLKVSESPPRAPAIKYNAPLGTRWAKEKAAAGGASAFHLPTDPATIGPWILGECVGKGASGRVKVAKHRHTGQLAAVKILPIAPLVNSRASLATQQAKSDKQRLGIDREIAMMKLMNHPNIMRIYDVYENDKELFLVLEYVEGGELFDFLVNRGRLPSAEALIYFRQIVYGLNYAHTFSIIHRDLKPENILIASLSPPLVKIADWGMAAFAPPSLHLETSCGSPHYASPEIVNGEKYQGNATDIWSCGVILYALLTGSLPFDDKNVRTLLSKVKSGKYEMPSWIDPLAKDLLSKMLVVNVPDRITIPEVLKHPWLASQPSVSFSATDGKTYSLLPPPLPPSPTLLASPLASSDLIDPELLSSLKVIWGRHIDPSGESIRRDLCSPTGQGVHTKAFYYLLGKYREETLKMDIDSEDVVMTEVGSTPATRAPTPSDLANGLRKYRVAKSHCLSIRNGTNSHPPVSAEKADDEAVVRRPVSVIVGPPPQTAIRKRTVTDGSITGARSNFLPASRASANHKHQMELWRTHMNAAQRDDDTAGFTRPRSSLGGFVRSGLPRPQPRRGHSSVVLPNTGDLEPPASAPVTAMGFSQHLQRLQARTPTTATFMTPLSQRPIAYGSSAPLDGGVRKAVSSRASVAFDDAVMTSLASSAPEQPHMSEFLTNEELNSPPPNGHKAETRFIRTKVDSLAQKAIGQVQDVSRIPSQPVGLKDVLKSPGVAEARMSRSVRTKVKVDKENQVLEDGWNHVKYEPGSRGSVGLGVGGALGNRDVGNVSRSPSKVRKEKEKKMRPPPLDLPSLNPYLNPKRSTFSMLGSPITLSSPLYSPGAHKIMASPVVGEFKGWFSNLFNWKSSSHSGGLLYSPYDLQGTRSNVVGVLEGLRVLVTDAHASAEHSIVLHCHIDQAAVDPSTGIPLKAVRFKVEIRAGNVAAESSTTRSPIGTENPYFLAGRTAVAGAQTGLHPATPISPMSPGDLNETPAMTPSSRPWTSMNLGGRYSSYGTPLSSPLVPGFARWNSTFPAGYLCAIALTHEKGSMSTFRLVWRKLSQEYGDAGGPYPCFSPAIPGTPHDGHQGMAL